MTLTHEIVEGVNHGDLPDYSDIGDISVRAVFASLASALLTILIFRL
jgi:hypothetical protein